MKVLNTIQLAQEVAKLLGKPVLYISGFEADGDIIDDDGKFLAAPYLNIRDHGQVFMDCQGFIVCDSEEEMYHLYDLTYGDDGLTTRGVEARNRLSYTLYDGECRVYACTINAKGKVESENT